MSKSASIRINLTPTDIAMLLWGGETVSWADKENQDDWDAVVKKLEAANRRLQQASK
jgi:hypothetical protein